MKPSDSARVFFAANLALILSVVPAWAQVSYQSIAERTVLSDKPDEVAQTKSKSRAYPIFKMALKPFIVKHNKAALVGINEALQADPNFAPAYIIRAYINIDIDQPLAAVSDFERGLRLEPSLKTVNLCDIRAKTFIDLEKWDQALADLSQSIALQPMPWRFKMRGELYATVGKNDLALKDFDSAIKMTPLSSGLHRTRADFYTSQKKYKEAIADYSLAVKYAPDDPSLYGARANAYEKSGRHDLATIDRAKSSEEARATAF
jgi:tetratricopeptide (TPR) repeat protein